MAVSSAAIVAPVLKNMAGIVPEAKGAEKTDKTLTYYIKDTCIGCHHCFYECPVSAIHWGDDKYEIDQTKCIHCGTCEKTCNISAATHK